MTTILTILHVLVCVFLMLTVLLQAGKGGGMGAAFGGGSSSGTVFGGSGAGNFLKKLTVGAAVIFVFTSMSLAYLASSSGSDALKAYSAQQRHSAELKRQQDEAAQKAAGGAATAPAAEGETEPGVDTGDGAAVPAVPGEVKAPPTGDVVPVPSPGAAIEAATSSGETTALKPTTTGAPLAPVAVKPARTRPTETRPVETRPAEAPKVEATPATPPAATRPSTPAPAAPAPTPAPATPAP